MGRARWRTALIGLGSNLGDRIALMASAIRLLRTVPGVQVGRMSGVYRTSPVGNTAQPWFYNAVVMTRTRLSPAAMLRRLKRAEKDLGRTPRGRGGPREIDLDLLLCGDEVATGPSVRVPHPRMHERKFVLVPAVEVAGGFRHPGRGATMSALLSSLRTGERVSRLSAAAQRRFRRLAGAGC